MCQDPEDPKMKNIKKNLVLMDLKVYHIPH